MNKYIIKLLLNIFINDILNYKNSIIKKNK